MKKLVIGLLAVIAFSTAASAYTGNADQLTTWQIEAEVYEKINEERTQRGLEPLEYDPDFSDAADDHSDEMADQNQMFHTRGIIKSMGGADSGCWSAAENVAYTYSYSKSEEEVADRLVEMWMNSPGHRHNILSEGYDSTGIGVSSGNSQVLYATQNFCS
jgi:uncharacterized protein YkwD